MKYLGNVGDDVMANDVGGLGGGDEQRSGGGEEKRWH